MSKFDEIDEFLDVEPVDASTIDNSIGTARGVHFKNKKFNLFALPGVPSETESDEDEENSIG